MFEPINENWENVMETRPDIQEQQRSYLFLVRLWQEQLGQEQTEWRGKVLYVNSGEEIYFRDREGIVAALQKMLDLSNPKPLNAETKP